MVASVREGLERGVKLTSALSQLAIILQGAKDSARAHPDALFAIRRAHPNAALPLTERCCSDTPESPQPAVLHPSAAALSSRAR